MPVIVLDSKIYFFKVVSVYKQANQQRCSINGVGLMHELKFQEVS